MQRSLFDDFFQGSAMRHLLRAIRDALTEDGPDLTSNAVFGEEDRLRAQITAKEDSLAVGLPIIGLTLDESSNQEPGDWNLSLKVQEGARLTAGEVIAHMEGSARVILRAERVILNFICHLSGIANLTRRYADALQGTGVRLLDTRKTLPGLRYPEKYAVLAGGGLNHRKNLSEMLMLKDNHIDAAGGVSKAVEKLRAAYAGHIPIEVECRDLAELRSAVACNVARVMLDNMKPDMMQEALALVPPHIEVEISGGVSLESIALLAGTGSSRRPDFISVGRLTHSAPSADFSMQITSP